MENIIFDKWIEIKKGVKVRIKRKTNSDNSSVLILEINEDGIFKQKVLFEKERKVFDESGKIIDFGDAYPIVTEYGKIMITKKFINVWI
ncbi:MAG: hypothetical protein UHO11_08250 [Treponema sp.]|nr:hypothetical protein [Treponema sp.]